jgi:peptidoglycan/xylan/chitin deacetylase (PgdA/CDA1 family)
MAAQKSPWPEGIRGAVSITFDDGMPSQLATALPAMDKHGLKGTFYLCASEKAVPKLSAWKDVAKRGHEIGNHTAHHPCPENVLEPSRSGLPVLEEMSVEEYEAEMLEAARGIAELAPAQKATSFAYPCYEPFVGRGAGRASVVPLVARHCIAGRGFGEAPFANDPWRADLSHLWAWPCERKGAPELIGLVEHAVAQGRWAVLVFHGVHEGHLSVGAGDFEALCTHLARPGNGIWTAPVAEIARHLVEARKSA